jgi:hypothetical protein
MPINKRYLLVLLLDLRYLRFRLLLQCLLTKVVQTSLLSIYCHSEGVFIELSVVINQFSFTKVCITLVLKVVPSNGNHICTTGFP